MVGKIVAAAYTHNNHTHNNMRSHFSNEASTPTWTPVDDENEETAEQLKRTVINYILLFTSILLVVYILFGSFNFLWMAHTLFKTEYLLQTLESYETMSLLSFCGVN